MRTNLHTGINELTVPTRASALRSKFAFLAIVVLAVFGLTNAGRTQERNPPDERQPDVVQDSGTTLSEAREVPAGSAASQPAAQLASPPVANIEKNIARIGETANWRFVTKDFIETIEKRQSELQGVAVNVLGVVRDEHGDFVEGAFVLLRLVSASSLVHRIDGQAKDVFAVTWTDDKGVFAFHNQATPWFESARPIDWELCVFAPGHAIETREYLNLDGQIRKEEIELQPEQVIEVTIKDSEGRPISDIDFAHVEIVDPYDNADLEYSLLGSEMQHFIQPDKQGRIRIGGLPRQRIATIIPRHGRVTGGKRGVHIATSADLEPQKMIAKERPRSGLVYPYLKPTCEIVAERPT